MYPNPFKYYIIIWPQPFFKTGIFLIPTAAVTSKINMSTNNAVTGLTCMATHAILFLTLVSHFLLSSQTLHVQEYPLGTSKLVELWEHCLHCMMFDSAFSCRGFYAAQLKAIRYFHLQCID
jgi:hypothetical protein